MKKYLAVVLGVLLILSFAVVASAQEPQITLGGKILVRGWYLDNVSINSVTLWDDTNANGRIDTSEPISDSFSLNLPIDEQGTIAYDELTDTLYYTSRDVGSKSLYTTNANITIDAKVSDNLRGFMELETTSAGNTQTGLYMWGTYEAKPASDLYFRQLWLQYTGSGLLGVPAGIKAGHMPLTLGEKQFLNHERFGDDAIVLTVEPTKELLIGLLTAKLSEGDWQDNTDDLDAYTLLGIYKLDKDNTIGLNYTLISNSDSDLSFQNLGLHANGNVSGLSYAAEVDFQFGEVAEDDIKYSGYGIFAKLGYMVDPVNLRASFAMGSGDDFEDDNKIKEFQTTMGPDTIGPLARYVHYTQIYERTISTTAQEQTLGGPFRNSGIANTTYYNIGLDYNPVADLNLSLDGFIIRATKNELGSKSAGTEIDFKGTYKIAKNLSYFVEAGMFSPGKYYEDLLAEIAGVDIDKKNVTQVVHGLLLTF